VSCNESINQSVRLFQVRNRLGITLKGEEDGQISKNILDKNSEIKTHTQHTKVSHFHFAIAFWQM